MKPCGPHTALWRLLAATNNFNIGLYVQLALQHGIGQGAFQPLLCSRMVGIDHARHLPLAGAEGPRRPPRGEDHQIAGERLGPKGT